MHTQVVKTYTFFKDLLYLIMCRQASTHECGYMLGSENPLELELLVFVSSLTKAPGTECGSSARGAHSLNC